MAKYIAKTQQGLENVLAEEVKILGANNIKILQRAVSFEGDKRLMYEVNLRSRATIRVLQEMQSFTCKNVFDLVSGVKRIPWMELMKVDDTFVIDTVGKHPSFNNTLFVSQKVKDVIADMFKITAGERPSVDKEDPTLRINVHLGRENCTISLDSSGRSLHKRGYRIEESRAPLNEVLAAGIVMMSGWDKSQVFVDGMCGSGTFPIEAAMIGNDIAPGSYDMRFGFMKWNDFDDAIWKDLVKNSKLLENTERLNIYGLDNNHDALDAAKLNAMNAEVIASMHLEQEVFFDFNPPEGPGVVVLNPPYGERIRDEDLEEMYEKIGDCLKKKYSGYDAWIISSNMEALKRVGLKTSKRLNVFNGPLECKLLKYELYKGSRKKK